MSLPYPRGYTKLLRTARKCSIRHYSVENSLPRPYRFHVGASWAGKPRDRRAPPLLVKPFSPDSEIGRWRDVQLSRHYSPYGSHIGEDFFYIQEVSSHWCLDCLFNLTHAFLDAKPVGTSNHDIHCFTLTETALFQGVAFGIADGVGGWIDSGIDPSLFSQALMYHAHRYAKLSWAGEPEIDPTQGYEEREEVEGWELAPSECLELAYAGVLRERVVAAGEWVCNADNRLLIICVSGSSTACLLTLNASSGLLRAAKLVIPVHS